MGHASAHLFKALGAFIVAFSLAGCGRSDDPAPAAAQPDPQALAVSQHDEAIVARRGWARAELRFGAPEPAGSGAPTFAGLGPFRLGMSIDLVRSAARRAHMYGGGFGPSSGAETAWCAPPIGSDGAALILAPKDALFNSNGCRSSGPGACTTYQLSFRPVGSRLRLTSIHVSDARQVHASEALMRRLSRNGDARVFTPCALTFGERDRLERWDRLEAGNLVDILGDPDLDKDRLPPAVRATLDRWERSATVRPDGDCCDLYSLSPQYDGHWQSGGHFVIGYSLAIGGEAPHSIPYVLVVAPGGTIVWSGAMKEYERHGLNGAQRVAREVH